MADDWTPEQQDVLAWQQQCISTENFDEFQSCFHKDFVGLGMELGPMPTSKTERMQLEREQWESVASSLVLFKPLSVYVNNDFAAIGYVAWYEQTNRETGAQDTVAFRWLDILLNDNGTWYWISDHGVKGP